MIADLHERAADGDAFEHFARNRAGGNAGRCLARRGPPAAAVVADAVLLPIGVVGVPGTELVDDVAVVLRALIDVADHQRDRRAGRHLASVRVREYARQDLDLVWLLALRGEARLTRAPLVEERLDIGRLQRQSRRAAVDHAAERRPVALAPGRHAEQMAESVVGHRLSPSVRGMATRMRVQPWRRGSCASLRSASACPQGSWTAKAVTDSLDPVYLGVSTASRYATSCQETAR